MIPLNYRLNYTFKIYLKLQEFLDEINCTLEGMTVINIFDFYS